MQTNRPILKPNEREKSILMFMYNALRRPIQREKIEIDNRHI